MYWDLNIPYPATKQLARQLALMAIQRQTITDAQSAAVLCAQTDLSLCIQSRAMLTDILVLATCFPCCPAGRQLATTASCGRAR
jgi:hypothetical protein